MVTISIAPLISSFILPKDIFYEIDADKNVHCLVYVDSCLYPLFYAWLLKEGAFKQGEQGYVGII